MARQPILKCSAAINKQLPGNNPPHFPVLRPSELTDDAAKDRFAEIPRLFAIAQHARSLVTLGMLPKDGHGLLAEGSSGYDVNRRVQVKFMFFHCSALLEVIQIEPLQCYCARCRHSDVVLDHQICETRPVDQDHLLDHRLRVFCGSGGKGADGDEDAFVRLLPASAPTKLWISFRP